MTQNTPDAADRGARTPSAIDALAERYVADVLALHPDEATTLGFPGHETEYADFSPAGTRADDELIARLLADLEALVITTNFPDVFLWLATRFWSWLNIISSPLLRSLAFDVSHVAALRTSSLT